MEKRRIDYFIDDLNDNFSNNYQIVESIFENEYGYPELDPLRDEICRCIICGLNQAAITLTNHLLESALKKCLIYKFTIDSGPHKDSPIDQIFNSGIEKFDNSKSDLSKSINSACSMGLITKHQKKLLHIFREKFRNAYSHASSKDTFNDILVTGREVTSVEEIFKPSNKEFKVTDVPFIHGIIQYELAKLQSFPYLEAVDEIVRHMIKMLRKKDSNC